MNRSSLTVFILAIAMLGALAPASARAQGDAYMRATDLEQRGDLRAAASAYRAALRGVNAEAALLDYERVCADAGCTDSVVVLVDSLLRARPTWTLGHTVQLRALRMSNRAPAARQAFERWAAADPRSIVPYREYARLLIQGGGVAEADTILRRGRSLGGGRDLALEVAQQRAAMGQWVPSAASWREALAVQSYLVQAATFALRPTPPDQRPAVLAALMESPALAGARATAAGLALGWGSPAEGWAALAGLPAGDSAVASWRDFGEQAEDAGAWTVARDAFTAVYRVTGNALDASRAGAAALAAGDAEGALALVSRVTPPRDSAMAAGVAALLLPVRVRALAQLGRAEEADRLAQAGGAGVTAAVQAQLAREAALGWVRRGDVPRARAALARAGGDDDVAGLLAVYEGDLAAARPLLKRPSDPSPDVVLALAMLGRTTVASAPAAGRAFLLLARGDSAGAAVAFEGAAAEVGDAAPALVMEAARLHEALGAADRATRAWERVLREHPTSPEAPEADLAWGRWLARRGDAAGASARFEHLIVKYPESALAPQARAARASLPTGAGAA